MNKQHISDDQARAFDAMADLSSRYTAPQGRHEQGWQIRPAASSAEIGSEDQSSSADAEVIAVLLIWLLAAITCCVCAWAVATKWGLL